MIEERVSLASDAGETKTLKIDLDKAGAAASMLCAIHCAVMPIAVTILPLIGLGFLANEWVEWTLVGTTATLGLTSLCLGFREHGKRRALTILTIGLSLITLGRVCDHNANKGWGAPLMVLGGLAIAGAHMLNRRLCMSCRLCHPENH